MSTENILDYGAVSAPDDPDMATAQQNRDAIIDAANAAGTGGTVYVPEGTYPFGNNDGYWNTMFGTQAPAGISFVGDGPGQSALLMTEHLPTDASHTMLNYHGDGTDHGSVTMENLRIDGNYENLGDLEAESQANRAVQLLRDATLDLSISNVHFRGLYSEALRLHEYDVTIDRCTFEEIGIGGRQDGGSGHAIETWVESGNRLTVTNSLILNVASFALNHRYRTGEVYVENCYIEGTGTGMLKLSAGSYHEYKNVYHQANNSFLDNNVPSSSDPTQRFNGQNLVNSIFNRPSEVPTVHFDNFEGRNYTLSAFEVFNDPIEVTGDMFAIHDACMDGSTGALDDDGSDGPLRNTNLGRFSVHGSNAPAFDTPGSSGSIDALRRDDNAGGLGDTGSISIGTDEAGVSPFQPTVPSKDEVGCDADFETGTDSGRDPATFATDFADVTFEEFTPKWASASEDWQLATTSSGATVLELAPAAAGRHALAWDAVGSAADAETLALVRVPSNDDNYSDWARTYARGADDETAYFTSLHDNDGFAVRKYASGSGATVGTAGAPALGTWYWTRMQVSGSDIRFKYWEYSASEPDVWNVETTDSSVTDAGWVGLGGYPSDVQQFAYFGAGVGGASPEVPTESLSLEAPLFSDWSPQWTSDTDNWRVVSGTEFAGGYALYFEDNDDGAGQRALSWDLVGEPADVEILDKFRVPELTSDGVAGVHARAHVRSTTEAVGGYWVDVSEPGDAFRLVSAANGSTTTLATFGTPAADQFYYRRLRAEGDTIRAKVWPTGQAEPQNWDVEVTDTTHASGWVGLGTNSPGTVETDVFAVATDGGSVSYSGLESAPNVAWVSPVGGNTITGTTVLQIDAADTQDADDSLSVEYRVDGGSWVTTSYSATSGYYEASWDTSSVADGSHSLEARAADRAGNTGTATIEVTVDNATAVSVTSVGARDVRETGATLVGQFDAEESVDADVGFEYRAVGATSWNATSTQTVSGTSVEFTASVSELSAGSDYEFRAVLYAPDTGAGDAVSFQTVTETTTESLAIDRFEPADKSNPAWSRYDVEWAVSDADGNLDSVVVLLLYQGTVVAAEGTPVSGDTDSGITSVRDRGTVDEVRLVLNDTQNETVSTSTSV